LIVEIVQLEKQNILIGCIYRPPGTDVNLFNTDLLSVLNILDGEGRKIILLAGDYNLDLIKRDIRPPTGEFLNNMLSHSLIPTIRQPNRITQNLSSLLDNVFVNSIQYNVQSAILFSDIADHLPEAIHMKTNIVKI